MLYVGKEPVEGEMVVFLGVHALRWQSSWGEPTMAFTPYEWKRTEDELPEIAENVLVSDTDGVIYIAWNGSNEDWRTEEGIFSLEHFPYWMPLPDAPRG